MTLGTAWSSATAIVDHEQRRPLEWLAWLPSQVQVLRCTDRFRCHRGPNQAVGKTWVGLAEVIFAATGIHPFRAPSRKAGKYWVVCSSWAQSVEIQQKLWELAPKDLTHPSTVYNEDTGFRGKNPSVRFLHTDGSYSIVRFKTAKQDEIDLSSASIDGALFDEPPAERVYNEIVKRVQAANGWVLICLTPINRPTGWLRELVDEGVLADLHVGLTATAMIPVGHTRPIRLADGRPCDQAWIDDVIRLTASHERPVRIDGLWEMRSVGSYFADAFNSDVHVHSGVPEGDLLLVFGVDHGHRPGKQIALLVAVSTDEAGVESYYVVDRYVDAEGTSTPAGDARGVLDMLARHGQRWIDLEEAHGDRVHMAGRGQQKSNLDLAGHIAKLCRVSQPSLRPHLRTVKQGKGQNQGSVGVGLRWMFHAFVQGRLGIHPRCTELIEALHKYQRAVNDPYADPVDALRYALHSYIFATHRNGPAAVIRIGS